MRGTAVGLTALAACRAAGFAAAFGAGLALPAAALWTSAGLALAFATGAGLRAGTFLTCLRAVVLLKMGRLEGGLKKERNFTTNP